MKLPNKKTKSSKRTKSNPICLDDSNKQNNVDKNEQSQESISPKSTEVAELFEGNDSSNLKFFYSNDRFIDTFDDKEIYATIQSYYPYFDLNDDNDSLKRKILVQMLENDEFISEFQNQYNMNIHDFFKYIYRICPTMFNGLFIKKIQNMLQNKQYAKSIKYSTYRYRKPSTKKRRFKL